MIWSHRLYCNAKCECGIKLSPLFASSRFCPCARPRCWWWHGNWKTTSHPGGHHRYAATRSISGSPLEGSKPQTQPQIYPSSSPCGTPTSRGAPPGQGESRSLHRGRCCEDRCPSCCYKPKQPCRANWGERRDWGARLSPAACGGGLERTAGEAAELWTQAVAGQGRPFQPAPCADRSKAPMSQIHT